MNITLDNDCYNIEVDITNVTALNGGGIFESDIFINIGNRANYHVTIRDSYICNSEGAAISVESFHPKAYVSQLIRITNSVIGKSKAGIRIHYYNSLDINITAIPQIVIEDCIIMDIHLASDDWKSGYGLLLFGQLAHFPVSVTLSNVSFENNQLSSQSGIELSNVRRVELIDCKFVGNQGTSITAIDSTFTVSGTPSFCEQHCVIYSVLSANEKEVVTLTASIFFVCFCSIGVSTA